MLRLPEAGEELFGFRLRQPLGHGAFACVYLAEQPDLASRPVVLKISAIAGTEPQTLARLQHTNIVPIFSVHEDQRAGLRAVCMPYFGGASLSSILERLWSETHTTDTGRSVDRGVWKRSPPRPGDAGRGVGKRTASEPTDTRAAGASRRLPWLCCAALSYQKAVVWIVAQLADGLHHAHQRGILHRDVKPSNILLSSEGQPLLLDFNVAQELQSDPAHAVLGGTVAYAAPGAPRCPEGLHPGPDPACRSAVGPLLAGAGPCRDADRRMHLRAGAAAIRPTPPSSRRWSSSGTRDRRRCG